MRGISHLFQNTLDIKFTITKVPKLTGDDIKVVLLQSKGPVLALQILDKAAKISHKHSSLFVLKH